MNRQPNMPRRPSEVCAALFRGRHRLGRYRVPSTIPSDRMTCLVAPRGQRRHVSTYAQASRLAVSALRNDGLDQQVSRHVGSDRRAIACHGRPQLSRRLQRD